MTDLGTLGGATSRALAINDRGQIVGEAETAAGVTHALQWDPTRRRMVDLGTLGGAGSSAAAINARGPIDRVRGDQPRD